MIKVGLTSHPGIKRIKPRVYYTLERDPPRIKHWTVPTALARHGSPAVLILQMGVNWARPPTTPAPNISDFKFQSGEIEVSISPHIYVARQVFLTAKYKWNLFMKKYRFFGKDEILLLSSFNAAFVKELWNVFDFMDNLMSVFRNTSVPENCQI